VRGNSWGGIGGGDLSGGLKGGLEDRGDKSSEERTTGALGEKAVFEGKSSGKGELVRWWEISEKKGNMEFGEKLRRIKTESRTEKKGGGGVCAQ